MKIDSEMELHNAGSSSSAAKKKRKRRKKKSKSNALCSSNGSAHNCTVGPSLMQDIPVKTNPCVKSAVDVSSISGLIEESAFQINSGLIVAQFNPVLACSPNSEKRKRKPKKKRDNAPTNSCVESTIDIGSNSDLIDESAFQINSGLTEAKYNPDLAGSNSNKKRKRKHKRKKDNENAESTVVSSSDQALIDACDNSSLTCSENMRKRQRQRLKEPNAVETNNRVVDLQEITSKEAAAPIVTVALVDMTSKADSRKDLVLPGENMLPEKHSSLHPSVDICPKNELVRKRSNGDVSLPNRHNAPEDGVLNLQMEHDKHLEKLDTAKMDLAAAPIEINASIDTIVHSKQKLSRSQRKKLKKLRKLGVHSHVLEHYANKDQVIAGDHSLSETMLPEKHSSLQPSVDIHLKNELVVKHSNGDDCLFSGCDVSENKRPINLQMANCKHLGNNEAKHAPRITELDLSIVGEDSPIYKEQFSSSDCANRSLLEKDDVNTGTRTIITYKRKKKVETYCKKEKKKGSKSLVNSLDCIMEDGDSLIKDGTLLPERQLEQKDIAKVDKIVINVHNASHVDGVSGEEDRSQIVQSPQRRLCIRRSKKQLLILDLNGLLVDIVPSPSGSYKPDTMVSSKAVFRRPYCDEFLRFCFERFNVGVWSSRVKRNLDKVINFLLRGSRNKLLFCWDASHCSKTGLNTLENEGKPLVLKELKKLWEKIDPNLPWEKGEYNETNTLLLDDSPYKALCNPAHTAIFPYSYDYRDAEDSSLGPGGDLRVYLEGLASAENVQEYVRQNPFGQQAITETNPSWDFYSKIFHTKPQPPSYDDSNSKVTAAKSCELHDDGNISLPCQQI